MSALALHTLHVTDEAAMLDLGRAIARVVTPGLVVHLAGDLGAGKTTLTRGVLAGLGHRGKVKSPTYPLLEPYSLSRLDFYHFDLYRIKDELEWHDAGFDELFDGRAVAFIEWPEKAARLVPPPDVRIALRVLPDGSREAVIAAITESGRACLSQLDHALSHAASPAGPDTGAPSDADSSPPAPSSPPSSSTRS
jgi:tRNA threonylcarbamoyladenosine biosynthesis protein TsaE